MFHKKCYRDPKLLVREKKRLATLQMCQSHVCAVLNEIQLMRLPADERNLNRTVRIRFIIKNAFGETHFFSRTSLDAAAHMRS